MKRLIFVVLFVAGAVLAAGLTSEVLVQSSAPTLMVRNPQSAGFEFYNHGPNAIWCAIGGDGGTALSGKSRKIASEGTWSAAQNGTVPVWCVADTAGQDSGAATVMTESIP